MADSIAANLWYHASRMRRASHSASMRTAAGLSACAALQPPLQSNEGPHVLQDGAEIVARKPPAFYSQPLLKPYVVFDVASGRDAAAVAAGGSRYNVAEVDLALALYQELRKVLNAKAAEAAARGMPSPPDYKVGVLSPYKRVPLLDSPARRASTLDVRPCATSARLAQHAARAFCKHERQKQGVVSQIARCFWQARERLLSRLFALATGRLHTTCAVLHPAAALRGQRDARGYGACIAVTSVDKRGSAAAHHAAAPVHPSGA
jgi:hypothetical protein